VQSVLNDFFSALDVAAANNSSRSSDFFKWPTTIFFIIIFRGGCNSKNKLSFNKTKLKWLLSDGDDGPEEELSHRPSDAAVFHYYYM